MRAQLENLASNLVLAPISVIASALYFNTRLIAAIAMKLSASVAEKFSGRPWFLEFLRCVLRIFDGRATEKIWYPIVVPFQTGNHTRVREVKSPKKKIIYKRAKEE